MLRNTPKTILWLLALLFAVTGCQQEDIQFPEEPNVMGRIVLNLSDIDVYVDAQTRATQTLDAVFPNFVFTLNGETVDHKPVTNQIVNFDNEGTAIIKAGTYTLTASTLAASQTGNGCPYYEGTSAEFTLGVGETQSVRIGSEKQPLTPQNAKVTLVLDQSFTDLYTFAKADSESELKTKYETRYDKEPGLKIHTHNNTTSRTLDLAQAWYDHSQNNSNDEAVYFPVDEGEIDYVIYAAAKPGTPEKPGSYITDIVGVSGSISPQAGKHYVITLKANTVSGEIIPILEGTHNDYFD